MISRHISCPAAVIFALTLGVAGTVLAQPAKPGAAEADTALSMLDTDKDGTLSMAEVKLAADQKFVALDADHDHTLDVKETKGLVSKKAFGLADPDSDGTLDKTEWEALVTTRFQAADKDHDATLDAKELASAKGKGLLKLLQH